MKEFKALEWRTTCVGEEVTVRCAKGNTPDPGEVVSIDGAPFAVLGLHFESPTSPRKVHFIVKPCVDGSVAPLSSFTTEQLLDELRRRLDVTQVTQRNLAPDDRERL